MKKLTLSIIFFLTSIYSFSQSIIEVKKKTYFKPFKFNLTQKTSINSFLTLEQGSFKNDFSKIESDPYCKSYVPFKPDLYRIKQYDYTFKMTHENKNTLFFPSTIIVK